MNKLVIMISVLTVAALLPATTGCRSGKAEKKKDEFFTSGNREADQRAQQRMARDQQIAGTKGKDEAKGKTGSPAESAAGKEERKLTLFERLGGDNGVNAIVDDFTQRAIADPRVNWERKGVKRSGFFNRNNSVTWTATEQNVGTLKQHIAQFLALATGGPAKYDGKEMAAVHTGMRITNAEFDAAVGDLKASLDKLQIGTKEQKELLAVIESTRPQIASER
ncbi:MAG TPA: group 1 truncated hemoglobin [Candidatus Binatia bacterium]|nr:group 1 truncated hemoglobin [Candidatus Binatia bacterium]